MLYLAEKRKIEEIRRKQRDDPFEGLNDKQIDEMLEILSYTEQSQMGVGTDDIIHPAPVWIPYRRTEEMYSHQHRGPAVCICAWYYYKEI